MALMSHFPLPTTLHSSKQFPFFVLLLSNGVTEDRSTQTNDRISSCTVLLLIEKNWYQKLLEIEKEIFMRLRSEDKHHLRKSANRKAQISSVSGTHGVLRFLYCAWGALGERERERERERYRERQKWRHLSSVEIGDEFCTFPCQKFAP